MLVLAVAISACNSRPVKAPSVSNTSVSYTIPDEDKIKRLTQTSDKTCWAAVGTMMWTWKYRQPIDIATMLGRLNNPTFLTYYNNDSAINSQQKVDFLKSMSLRYEFSSTFSPSYLLNKLQAFGPLWVTTNEGPDGSFSLVHARICYGISGNGTSAGTTILLIDPGNGQNVVESFDDFISKYQNASGIDIQMVHW